MHNERASYLGFRATFGACFLFVYDQPDMEFSLSAITNRFEMACQSKATDIIVTLSAIVVRESKRSTINTNLNLILLSQ